MAGTHVAHLNRGYMRGPWGDPAIAGFEDNLTRVNAVAERSTGFVVNVGVDAEAVKRLFFPDCADPARVAATLSVWESVAALEAFVHHTIHGRFLSRRDEWFESMPGPAYVIWPIPAGHVPTLAEARAAHDRLARDGAGPTAFDFAWAQDACAQGGLHLDGERGRTG